LRGNDRAIELAYSLHRLFLTARSAEAKQEAFDVRLVYFLLGGILNLAFLVLFRVGIDRTREEYEHTSHLMVFRRYKLLYYFDNKFKIGPIENVIICLGYVALNVRYMLGDFILGTTRICLNLTVQLGILAY